jgi:hypothetical protein
MTAGLMTQNSVYLNDVGAWHNWGYVSPVPMGATEALSKIDAVYYEKRPVQVFVNGKLQETGDFAIVRSPLPSMPKEEILGFVKKNYNILQPANICQEFDKNVNQPVETLGFLGSNGEKLFLTWVLPGFDVNGDEVKLYGFVAVGYDGKFGATLYVVTVRVVCANTWAMAVSEGENNKIEGKGKIWSGKHNSLNLERDLGIWMEHIQNKAMRQSESVSMMFNQMVKKHLDDTKELNKLLDNIYPDPNPIPVDFPDKLRFEKQEKIDVLVEKAKDDRIEVANLFGGAGTAITSDGWGLFNSVTEYENHVRMTKKPADYSILFGNRANTMTRAANVIMNWVVK